MKEPYLQSFFLSHPLHDLPSLLEKESIDRVIKYYGDKGPQWLSDLTHAEDLWHNARKGIPSRERSTKEITLESIVDYYASLNEEK